MELYWTSECTCTVTRNFGTLCEGFKVSGFLILKNSKYLNHRFTKFIGRFQQDSRIRLTLVAAPEFYLNVCCLVCQLIGLREGIDPSMRAIDL